ncbi:type IX secretion system membrane protein PorP/SprF [Lutibacter sp. HS1-25]|uniref:PorP/SprF family type IX secretion system membrane protein n=1 Tax=Lutibacter sp. HS1-25 TaxID=2485000 RepID=UPI00101022CC|nr:type IX secretion system membrane protein PorP/SprF [Lutibacter sp. HS1-25]RXP46614.1 type IX secretion system membrane protein PorP/SprF [Lutibacter sp. HS1-25]
MKKIFIQFITLFTATVLWSQQDVQYTQYMYNMSVINPAYTTGTLGVYNLGALYRTQWVGVKGAPTSTNIFAHTPINEQIEVGFTFVNDNIGNIVKENNIFADFAYKLNLEEYGQLSFGLKAGASFFNADLTSLNLESGSGNTDPNFSENIQESKFNIGAGVFYNKDNYYVGFSVPYILNEKHYINENGRYENLKKAHFYLTGGYVFDINSEFKLKPSFMAKAVNGAPIALDLNANVLYQDRLELGVGYRLNDAVVGMVNFGVTPKLRIGYAYDYTLAKLQAFSSGSHEFLLLYNLDQFNLNNGFDKSPRFF